MHLRKPHEIASPAGSIDRRPLGSFAEVEPLLGLCASGKLYEVEAWIGGGRPIQFAPPADRKLQRRPTALQIAVNRRFHSLAALLLANGYDPNGDYYECLSLAVRSKDSDLVALLIDFGADPRSVDFCEVLQSCDRAIMDRFVQAGIDPCAGNAVARSLSFKGRPILGFIKQYRDRFPGLQRQIDIALHVFTEAEDLRGIALMLWVGANPHATTPSSAEADSAESALGESAFQTALWARNAEVLKQFLKRPIPTEQLDSLLHRASYRSRPEVIRRLLHDGANPNAKGEDGYSVIYGFLNSLLWRHTFSTGDDKERGFEALEVLLQAGAKWEVDEPLMKQFRRELAGGESRTVIRIVELLRKHRAISSEQLHELTRTPAVRKVLNGFSRPYRDPLREIYVPIRPTVAIPVEPPKGRYWKRKWYQNQRP